MNLQPLRSMYQPVVSVLCSQCSTMHHTCHVLADLDAKPGAYYCFRCCDHIDRSASQRLRLESAAQFERLSERAKSEARRALGLDVSDVVARRKRKEQE